MSHTSDVFVYTANYGGYDSPKPLRPLGVPAYLYTDDPGLRVEGWQTRVYSLDHIRTPMLRAKWWKLHPGLVSGAADISMWLDSSMTVMVDDYVDKCLAALGDDDFTLVTHPWRDCIYEEAKYSALLPRYDAAVMYAQMAYYMQIGHPKDWGLFASGANVRRHTHAVIKHGVDWWWENTQRSHQDQLSLPVLIRLAGDTIKWNTNMPWHEWWHLGQHLR